MNVKDPNYLTKLIWSLPWLGRYPLWRAHELARRIIEASSPWHLIILVANHFEPGWDERGGLADWSTQLSRLEHWYKQARATGHAVRDFDDQPFRHTYFYPAEQYHPRLLEVMADAQAEGLGEVEIHLHHGVDKPDNAANLRRTLESFRDTLAEEHKCLSRQNSSGPPMYAFVHGNLALANSAGGRFCGVDSEMRVLAETGCYADFTLPSAPDRTQVARINAIYQCGHQLDKRMPHRSGPSLRVGRTPALPVLFTGPLVFNWQRRFHGLPVPRLDDGVLAANYPLDLSRLKRWQGARVGVRGRPEWVFIKLYCHGFFTYDQNAMIGEKIRRFLTEVLEYGDRSGRFKVHFATAREAFNIAMAAVDGYDGEPGAYRNYWLRPIMQLNGRESHTSVTGNPAHAGGRSESDTEKVI